MKKISILILAVFFIGIANINAQSDATSETLVVTEKVTEVKTCAKSGKVCDATCENKKKGTCCKGEKKSCSKSEKGNFDYGTTNDYSGEKSSCSKKAKKDCDKGAKKKGCCSKKGGEKKGCSKKTETKE